MGAFDAAHFVFVPIFEITKAIPGSPTVYVESHWLVDDRDRVAFFNPRNADGRRRDPRRLGSPQTNTDPRIGEIIGKRYPWCVGSRLIPVAFLPYDPGRIAGLIATSDADEERERVDGRPVASR